MSKGPAISQEELIETANRMEAEGKDVTALGLLNELGRGSLTTIYKYLEEWKSRRPAAPPPSKRDMPDPVRNIFQTAWSAAMAEAGREVEAVKEKAAQEVSEAQSQFKEALEAIARLEKESEAETERIEALSREAAELKEKTSKIEAERAAEKATVDSLRQQLSSQEQELERLRKELERERKEREGTVKEAAENKGRAETLQAQNDALLKALSERKGK